MGYSHIVYIVLATFLFIEYGNAIKCWTCSSDLDPQCADPFNNTTPRFNLHHTLTDCNTQSGPSYPFHRGKSACKKTRQIVNGEMVVIRACAWLPMDTDVVGECTHMSTPSYIKIEFCETCEGDACNGASANYNGLLVPFVLSIALALFFKK